ncbi:MAG: cupin domain-containing protein [Rhodospirillaceae bacterium]
MTTPILFAALLSATFTKTVQAAEPAPISPPPITREVLPSAQIAGTKPVDRVEVQKISLGANVKPGAHIHSAPVVGYIIEGSIVFQIEQQPARILKAGDTFFEPANTVISRFDAGDAPATFMAYYLLGKDEKNELKMAP